MVEFSDGPSLVARIKGYFPIQFGRYREDVYFIRSCINPFFLREVLASPLILNVPQKVNWKSCALSKEMEAKLTLEFRENFQPLDFTIEDDD